LDIKEELTWQPELAQPQVARLDELAAQALNDLLQDKTDPPKSAATQSKSNR
jgi:hypothetical protein